MIWKRTIASQMADARGRRITITIEGEGRVFQVSGKTIDFPGYLRAYVEGTDDPEAELADKETRAAERRRSARRSKCLRADSQRATPRKPPAGSAKRAHTQALEELGIGRPSTYASIIDTILARNYVFKKGNALVPTWVAFSVSHLLEGHLPSWSTTSSPPRWKTTSTRSAAARPSIVEYLRRFYFGNGTAGLKATVQTRSKRSTPAASAEFEIGTPDSGTYRDPIYLRVGRYGPFIEQGERETPNYRKASLPTELAPDELTVEKALELLEIGQQGEEPLGVCPDTDRNVYLKQGRFGPYVQLGGGEGDDDKPRNASLIKGMDPTNVTLERCAETFDFAA